MTNTILLLFFALPILVIVVSIALQRLLKCPPLVAAIIFAIFLVVTFIVGNLSFLIAALIYAIISFITAIIVAIICKLRERRRENCNYEECCCQRNWNNNDLLTIQSQCSNNNNGNLLTISSNGCNGESTSNNGVNARIRVIPNENTNGRTGCICGSFRRR